MKDLSNINNIARIILSIISGIILFILSLLFFQYLKPLLTTSILFVFDINNLISNILIPAIYFVLILILLTYGFVVCKYFFLCLGIPIAFIISQNFEPISILMGIIFLGILYLYRKTFFGDLDNFKRPSISRAVRIAFGLPLTLISIIFVCNFYNFYSNFINSGNITFDKNVTNLTSDISSGLQSDESGINKDDTVRSFAINTLHNQGAPITETNIDLVKEQLSKQFGLDVNDEDKLADLQTKVIENKLADFVKSHSQLSLAILMIIIFLSIQTFIKLCAWIAGFCIYLLESILKIFGIKFFPEYVSLAQ